MEKNLKKIPGSFTVLDEIVSGNYAFIDKTRFIQAYEESGLPITLFLRPRRFGKTMFVELLIYYYDSALETKGRELLKDTWISSHPTPLRNTYAVLRFDFCAVDNSGTSSAVINSFADQIVSGIEIFFNLHPEFNLAGSTARDVISKEIDELRVSSPSSVPSKIMDVFARLLGNNPLNLPRKLMIVIDEYDSFTNDILSRDQDLFSELARKNGAVGGFYRGLRYLNQQGVADRIFITGILPVTLDTSNSGFIYENISFLRQFNAMAGFTDSDLESLLEQTVEFGAASFSLPETKAEIRRRYNGYRFARTAARGNAPETVSNSALCLKFISEFREYCADDLFPPFTVYSGCDVDYDKLSGYLNLMREEDRTKLVDALIAGEPVKVGFPSVVKLSGEKRKLSMQEGLLLLYHLGFLTISSGDGAPGATPVLAIPNEYFRLIFCRYWFEAGGISWEKVDSSDADIGRLARVNDIGALETILLSEAECFVNTDVSSQGEMQIVLAVYCALSMNAGESFELSTEYRVRIDSKNVYADTMEEYQAKSQICSSAQTAGDGNSAPASGIAGKSRVVNTKSGRADLVAINRQGGPSYIFEFKYAQNRKAQPETISRTRKELYDQAVAQLNFYTQDDRLKTVSDLHRYVIMYTWGEFMIREAL